VKTLDSGTECTASRDFPDSRDAVDRHFLIDLGVASAHGATIQGITDTRVPNWIIPTIYAGAALACGFIVPRFEHAYLTSYLNDIAAASALAYLSAVASGMIAFTAIVFSIAYVTVQFNAIAYSPRLALWFASDPQLFHALGLFMATFLYAMATMVWVDRGAGGGVPLLSTLVVLALLIASTLQFGHLVRGLSDLQISSTLHLIGDRGRTVIDQMFFPAPEPRSRRLIGRLAAEPDHPPGPPTQVLRYSGKPRAIGRLDVQRLVIAAQQAGAVIELACAVGDTVLDDNVLLTVSEATCPLAESKLLAAIHLVPQRTFEQDPKYPIRLLVDIAIKALSPAINDPTTAVQAIDEIEDLLRRLGRCELDTGFVRDVEGVLRLIFPMPTWEDYLRLAFDEIRQYGGGSVQVMRRLRAALAGVAEVVAMRAERAASIERYIRQLDLIVDRSPLDAEDRVVASQEDRQGLGLSRKRQTPNHAPAKPQSGAARDSK
jgi:uncharacterized membrane protein